MLTREELAVLKSLADIYNAFCVLPLADSHPSGNDEFAHAIHQAQHLVMIRSAIRDHPATFNTIGRDITLIRG